MAEYSPPLKDIKFVLKEIAGLGPIVETDTFSHVDVETVEMVLDEVGRFMAEVIAPTNRDGDTIGAKWNDSEVNMPDSFRAAYKQYVDSGFNAVALSPEFGGGGFPAVTGIAIQEMLTSANMAFSLCPLLTQGAIDAFMHHGTDEQKAMYLPKMLTGEWTGTMNLTEPHAGSDVGALTTKAEPVGDGSYKIAGTKIFITFGEHDMSKNIIHLVLARTPGSPPGTRGISMFVVPKFLVNEDGSPGDRNDVSCVSIEHKLGIHGSPTAVLSFGEKDGAIGWLVGNENEGMRNMFTMMNNARLSVGLEGLSISERAYQDALLYAQERIQGTAVGAEKGTKSPIIDHADVRRMLMTQRAWIDAMRCLVYANAAELDRSRASADDDAKTAARELADLYIPLTKALCTDLGNEITSLAIQVHGGMGFVEETGVAQHYRDARIAPIYEGTNGIQAADLVGRKLAMRSGGVVLDHLAEIDGIAKEVASLDGFGKFADNLTQAVDTTRRSTNWLLANASTPNEVLAGSVPYLRMLATAVCGGLMARLAIAADSAADTDYGNAKKASAKFFGEQILPTANSLEGAVTAGSADLFALTAEQLA